MRGREVIAMTSRQVSDLAAGHHDVVIDVGTGDGNFVYGLARQRPETLCIGIDAARDGMEENAVRALRKPARGGVPNVLFVVAAAEEPPTELAGVADEIYV